MGAAAAFEEVSPASDVSNRLLADGTAKHVAVEGLVVGAVTGLVGSGGGFLVVPALAILGGLTQQAARVHRSRP